MIRVTLPIAKSMVNTCFFLQKNCRLPGVIPEIFRILKFFLKTEFVFQSFFSSDFDEYLPRLLANQTDIVGELSTRKSERFDKVALSTHILEYFPVYILSKRKLSPKGSAIEIASVAVALYLALILFGSLINSQIQYKRVTRVACIPFFALCFLSLVIYVQAVITSGLITTFDLPFRDFKALERSACRRELVFLVRKPDESFLERITNEYPTCELSPQIQVKGKNELFEHLVSDQLTASSVSQPTAWLMLANAKFKNIDYLIINSAMSRYKAFPMRKGFKHARAISRQISFFQEYGLIDNILKRYLHHQRKVESPFRNFQPVTVMNTVKISIIGNAFSFLHLGVEIMVAKKGLLVQDMHVVKRLKGTTSALFAG